MVLKIECTIIELSSNFTVLEFVFFQNELAGLGGDIGFLKNELDMQVNVPVTKELVSLRSYLLQHSDEIF